MAMITTTKTADDFNVANKVYTKAQPVDDYIAPELINSL